jgi:protein TonB
VVYPEAARLRGTEGVVGLRILLDGSGTLADLKIERSSGSSLLDRTARETVAACLPVPNPSGAPLAFDLAVRFSLQKKAAAP